MSLKKKADFLRTTTFRLTLWYTTVFGGLSFVVFIIIYVSLMSHLKEQTDNELLNKAKEFSVLYDNHGTQALQSEFRRESESSGIKRVFFRLLSPQGEILVSSDLRQWTWLKSSRNQSGYTVEKGFSFNTLSLPNHQHKVRVVSKFTIDGNMIEVGSSLQSNELMMVKYREIFGIALMIMLICGGFVAWLLARKVMSGVCRVTQTANRIRKGDLSRRVPLGNEGQEIDALAVAFNGMLERIESLVGELKQVTDNVAHELRTPITRIRGMAEMTLDGDIGEYRELAALVIEESDRLIEMINTMLEIARTDLGVTQLASDPLDLRKTIAEAIDLFKPLAENKNINIHVDTLSQDVIVKGDRSKLQRVVANLLDNAIKYTSSGGKIVVSARMEDLQAVITIADTGIGIDTNDIPKIFDRFYRGDKSRTTFGSGLGLSLALTIVKAHGGDITVDSSLDTGSVFTIILPLT